MAANQSIYPLDSSLTLSVAGSMWLEEHARRLKAITVHGYKNALKPLTAHLGSELRLTEIDINHLRGYQLTRAGQAGPHLINAELGVLQQIMKEAGQWERVKEFYKPLNVPNLKAGHSLTADEENRLREVAFSKPKWRMAAHCVTVMLSTTMGFGELRHIRRRDVDLGKRSVQVVDGAKNDFRDRNIPLNAAAFESMAWLIERWKKLGGMREDDYLLPHRPRSNQGPWIFSEPMTAITSAFRQIRKAAGIPHFRIYDCRVQAITKLLSNPKVSPQVSKEIAGHISQAMQNRYSIQQFETKRAALEALEGPSTPSEPAPPVAATFSLDLLQSVIQAEIALALQRERSGGPGGAR